RRPAAAASRTRPAWRCPGTAARTARTASRPPPRLPSARAAWPTEPRHLAVHPGREQPHRVPPGGAPGLGRRPPPGRAWRSATSPLRATHAPAPLVPPSRSFASALRLLLSAAALATGLIALWLGFVVADVLPSRDPQHVGTWTAIAVAFLAYSALTLGCIARGRRRAWLPWALVVGSLAALAFGGYAVTSMVRAADDGTRFEGYLLVMGVVLAGHGACALAYATLVLTAPRRLA